MLKKVVIIQQKHEAVNCLSTHHKVYDSSTHQSLSKRHLFHLLNLLSLHAAAPLAPPLLFQTKTSMHGPWCLLRSNCTGPLREMGPAGLNPHCYWEHKDNNSQQQRVSPLSPPFLPGMVRACTDWHSNVFHLTPLIVSFPGYCSH